MDRIERILDLVKILNELGISKEIIINGKLSLEENNIRKEISIFKITKQPQVNHYTQYQPPTCLLHMRLIFAAIYLLRYQPIAESNKQQY